MDFLKANTCDAVPFPTCMGDTDLTPATVQRSRSGRVRTSGRQDELPVAVFALFIGIFETTSYSTWYLVPGTYAFEVTAYYWFHVRYGSLLFARTL